MKNYDKVVMDHYSQVAREDGDSSLATMKNQYVRDKETQAIINCISEYIARNTKKNITAVDVGCGNGYTLGVLADAFPGIKLVGLERNDDLRQIANKRLNAMSVHVLKGNIMEDMRTLIEQKDIVICQRVVINILEKEDQITTIHNIERLVAPGGILIMIECMTESLDKLNTAREEFDFPPIEPSYHNLYLREDMLPSKDDGFIKYEGSGVTGENFLSSHYYVSRVLHDIALQGKEFKRNSEFVKFMTSSLPDGIGDYSPIKFYVFQRMEK